MRVVVVRASGECEEAYRLRNSSFGAEESCEDEESLRMCFPPRPYENPGGLCCAHSASCASNALPSRWKSTMCQSS